MQSDFITKIHELKTTFNSVETESSKTWGGRNIIFDTTESSKIFKENYKKIFTLMQEINKSNGACKADLKAITPLFIKIKEFMLKEQVIEYSGNTFDKLKAIGTQFFKHGFKAFTKIYIKRDPSQTTESFDALAKDIFNKAFFESQSTNQDPSSNPLIPKPTSAADISKPPNLPTSAIPPNLSSTNPDILQTDEPSTKTHEQQTSEIFNKVSPESQSTNQDPANNPLIQKSTSSVDVSLPIEEPKNPSTPAILPEPSSTRPDILQSDEPSIKTHREQTSEIFNKHKITTQSSHPMWTHFKIGNPENSASNCNSYENSKNLYKIFLNPTRAHFAKVLDRVITEATTEGISCEAKIIHDIPRKSQGSALDDPTEPKILLYIVGSNSEQADKKLVQTIEMLEKAFSIDEMETFACPQGSRTRADRTVVPQWGPSFTRHHTNLIFYSQGGFTESQRDRKLNELDQWFTGENFYLYKGHTDPVLQKKRIATASKRIERFVQYQLEDSLNMNQDSSTISQKFEASYTHKLVRTQLLLKKSSPTDEEIARCHNMSIHDLRVQKIASCYLNLCKNNKQQTPFSAEIIETDLRAHAQTIETWLLAGETLAEKRALVTALGSDRILENPTSTDTYLEDVQSICDYIENDFSSFAEPFTILKLFNISQALHHIQETNQSKDTNACDPLILKIDQFITAILKIMELQRKGSVWEIIQAESTPEKLRRTIVHKTWGISLFDQTDCLYKTREVQTSLANGKIVDAVILRANQLKEIVEDALASPPHLESLNTGSIEIDRFYNQATDKEKALKLLQEKLINVIKRQQQRQNRLKEGTTISIPLLFHGAPSEDTIFQVAASEIRYAHATYNASFVSTNPAMLRYGGAILGMGTEKAFRAPIGISEHHNQLVIPHNEPVLPNVFRDIDFERWIGFKNSLTVNPQIDELNQQFKESLQGNLVKILLEEKPDLGMDSEELHKQVLVILDLLKEQHLTFVPDETGKIWTPYYMDKKTYKPISKDILLKLTGIQSIDTLWSAIGGDATGTQITMPGTFRFPTTPYFIGLDDEEELQTYFKESRAYKNRQQNKKEVSISSIRQKAITEAQKNQAPLTEEEATKLEEEINFHCIPLMEQIIEFNCISEYLGGPLVLKEWMNS